MSTGPTRATRDLVIARDQWQCVSCRQSIYDIGYSIHHRIPRGMGGSRDTRLNLPSNLLTVCGSGTTGCHGWIESHRVNARAWGYLLYRLADPATCSVYTANGYALFTDDGTVEYLQPPNLSADRLAELARDIERAIVTRTGAVA